MAVAGATYRVVIEYDGTDFCGLQFQPDQRTVAGELERALSELFDQPVKISAAGRTDTGVHATGQIISFVAHDRFPIERLALALNSELPRDLSARDAERVPDSFNARASAVERTYVYTVLNRNAPSAPLRRWTHFEHRALDLERMRAGAAALIGTHDFVTFCGELPERGGTVRTVNAIDIERRGELVLFRYRAAGFLHRMVRVMTGTLLEAGTGRREPAAVAAMLAARDRREAGLTAPPQGLCLVDVRCDDGFRSGRPPGATVPFDTPGAAG